MIKIGCFATKIKIYNEKAFLENNFNNKKTVIVMFADHG